MSTKSEVTTRRRRVAQLRAEGMSLTEIASALKLRLELVEADSKAIAADPNNLDYLQRKQALQGVLDNYDRIEREAREHLQTSLDQGKLDAANRWFESIRRIATDRGRVLEKIGVLNRAVDDLPAEDQPRSLEETLSPRARKLIARIALAEKVGDTWDAHLEIQHTTAEEPVPDPDWPARAASAPAAPDLLR